MTAIWVRPSGFGDGRQRSFLRTCTHRLATQQHVVLTRDIRWQYMCCKKAVPDRGQTFDRARRKWRKAWQQKREARRARSARRRAAVARKVAARRAAARSGAVVVRRRQQPHLKRCDRRTATVSPV